METFDVVVIGGGAIGENAAARAVQGGLSAALVDKELFGGECSYWACMPSKALLLPGHVREHARRMPGVRVSDELDADAVLSRRNTITHNWDDSDQVKWAQSANVELVRGVGRITGEREVTVPGLEGERVLRAEHAVVVCSGSVPILPKIPGIDDVDVWTSRQATSAQRVPASMAVLGGGVVGVELAQAWARLGSTVTLVVAGERPLHKMEEMAGDLVVDGLRADGVDVRLGVSADQVSKVDDGARMVLSDGSEVTAEVLLAATGRRPNTDDIGLHSIGLTPGETLRVDDSGQVSGVEGGWLYAAGDVTGRAPLTHQGKYAARIVGDVLAAKAAGRPVDTRPWSRHQATADHACVPQVIFTDPEVAFVGRTAAQAAADGIEHRVVEIDIAVGGSTLYMDGYTGKARMVVDTGRNVLIGVTFVGSGVAEMLHSATVAVAGEVPLDRLWHAVPAYPTISEVWLRLMEAYGL
jgi:dihydrolipoamide dehydrogenase